MVLFQRHRFQTVKNWICAEKKVILIDSKRRIGFAKQLVLAAFIVFSPRSNDRRDPLLAGKVNMAACIRWTRCVASTYTMLPDHFSRFQVERRSDAYCRNEIDLAANQDR